MVKAMNYFYLCAKGRPVFQIIAMVTGTLNVICSGLHYGWSSPSLPKLLSNDSQIPLTNEEGSWITVTMMFGSVCGSFLGGIILNLCSRKLVIILSSVPFFISWILVYYARSFLMLLTARIIAGIGDGLIFCVIPMYLGEISDPKIRGFLTSSVNVIWTFGILLINVIGSYLSIPTTALICSLCPVMCVLTFIWMPESPYYLVMKGNLDRARHNLRIFRGRPDVEEEFERLSQAVQEQNQESPGSAKFFDLFTVKSNRRAVIIMLGVRIAKQLSGRTAITFYAHMIFEEAAEVIAPSTASIIYFSVALILACVSTLIVDKTGRRPLLIISITGSGIILFVVGSFFYFQKVTDFDTKHLSWIPIATLILYVVLFSIGLETIPVLLLGELFPTNVKAYACSFSEATYVILIASVTKFFQFTKDEFGLHVPFFSFFVCCVLGLVFIIFFVPETKGKTLEEIQQELKEGTKNKKPKSIEEGQPEQQQQQNQTATATNNNNNKKEEEIPIERFKQLDVL